ncbi:unnamed protein product [Amoebophrya sp. A120]|nr:unnamed protein product [Amoebophrya sp. A120]|eukprot:GSA120T00022269001.1
MLGQEVEQEGLLVSVARRPQHVFHEQQKDNFYPADTGTPRDLSPQKTQRLPPLPADPTAPANIALGVFLQIICIFLLSSTRIAMKQTARVGLTPRELATYQYGMNITLLLVVTYWYEEGSFANWWKLYSNLSTFDYALFFFVAIVITFYANQKQIEAVRILGPTLYSSFQPLRLVSSVCGSYFLLREPVESAVSWVGIFLLCCTLWVYFGMQLWEKKKMDMVEGAKLMSSTEADLEKYERCTKTELKLVSGHGHFAANTDEETTRTTKKNKHPDDEDEDETFEIKIDNKIKTIGKNTREVNRVGMME